MVHNPKTFDNKVDKLSRYYDLSNPRDLFTVTMQEMELLDVRVAVNVPEATSADKKKAILDLIGKIAEKQGIEEINLIGAVSAYVDDMCRASKRQYAINKEYK